jgi:predicted dinucleotide-binding enzyme
MSNVTIIGTGNVGSALGKALAGAGHQVVFAGRERAKVGATAQAAGAAVATSTAEAVAGAWNTAVVLVAPPAAAVA